MMVYLVLISGRVRKSDFIDESPTICGSRASKHVPVFASLYCCCFVADLTLYRQSINPNLESSMA